MKEIKKIDEKELAVKTPAQAEQILEQEKEAIAVHEEIAAEVPAVGVPAAGIPAGGKGGGRPDLAQGGVQQAEKLLGVSGRRSARLFILRYTGPIWLVSR